MSGSVETLDIADYDKVNIKAMSKFIYFIISGDEHQHKSSFSSHPGFKIQNRIFLIILRTASLPRRSSQLFLRPKAASCTSQGSHHVFRGIF